MCKRLIYLPVFLSVFLLLSCSTTGKMGTPQIPRESYYHYILAVEAEASQDWEEALKHLKLALKADPESVHLKTEIGRIYYKSERMEEAIGILKTAIEKENRKFIVHGNGILK